MAMPGKPGHTINVAELKYYCTYTNCCRLPSQTGSWYRKKKQVGYMLIIVPSKNNQNSFFYYLLLSRSSLKCLPSVSTFKRALKAHLFHLSFSVYFMTVSVCLLRIDNVKRPWSGSCHLRRSKFDYFTLHYITSWGASQKKTFCFLKWITISGAITAQWLVPPSLPPSSKTCTI
jgi:hypothetical protein